MIPKPIDQHMHASLKEAVLSLFPVGVDANAIVRRHVWRTIKDLGEFNGSVVAWQGWSANLRKVYQDYRTLYVDYVVNMLPQIERERLFGSEFANSVRGMESFVVMFVANFPHRMISNISNAGYIARKIGPNAHACIVVEPTQFLAQPAMTWAAHIAGQAHFQKEILLAKHTRRSSPPGSSEWLRELEWKDENLLLDI